MKHQNEYFEAWDKWHKFPENIVQEIGKIVVLHTTENIEESIKRIIILDAGVGTGVNSLRIALACKKLLMESSPDLDLVYVGFDKDKDVSSILNQRKKALRLEEFIDYHFYFWDIESEDLFPFPQKPNVIWLIDFLHWLRDPCHGIAKLQRINPNSLIFFGTPTRDIRLLVGDFNDETLERYSEDIKIFFSTIKRVFLLGSDAKIYSTNTNYFENLWKKLRYKLQGSYTLEWEIVTTYEDLLKIYHLGTLASMRNSFERKYLNRKREKVIQFLGNGFLKKALNLRMGEVIYVYRYEEN
ncbi:MAG: class I SAM-dependent methyltransferase [Rhodocyclaceae bacterium]|nr:class I SAM-dependent methyltransferase [Rhodocyclaceae bacterium]